MVRVVVTAWHAGRAMATMRFCVFFVCFKALGFGGGRDSTSGQLLRGGEQRLKGCSVATCCQTQGGWPAWQATIHKFSFHSTSLLVLRGCADGASLPTSLHSRRRQQKMQQFGVEDLSLLSKVKNPLLDATNACHNLVPKSFPSYWCCAS